MKGSFAAFKILGFIAVVVLAMALLALSIANNGGNDTSVAAVTCTAKCYGLTATVPVGFSCLATDYKTCQQCAANGKMVTGSQYCPQTVCYGHCFTEPSCSTNYDEGTQCTGLDYKCYYCQNGKFLTTSQGPCGSEIVKSLRQYTCSGSALTAPPGPPPTKSSSSVSSSSKPKSSSAVATSKSSLSASSLTTTSSTVSTQSTPISSSSSSADGGESQPSDSNLIPFILLACAGALLMIVAIIFLFPRVQPLVAARRKRKQSEVPASHH